ncbi:MAG: cyclic nucleotide-binding domain-containing protein, partial [Thermoleophilia bacterium]
MATTTSGSGDPLKAADPINERARFLSRNEPFRGLRDDELERVAAALVERIVVADEPVLIEGGPPGTQLFVVRSGTLELVHGDVVLDIITSGQAFGHPTLLTGLAPEFTVRAREVSTLYCVPGDVALELLSR